MDEFFVSITIKYLESTQSYQDVISTEEATTEEARFNLAYNKCYEYIGMPDCHFPPDRDNFDNYAVVLHYFSAKN